MFLFGQILTPAWTNRILTDDRAVPDDGAFKHHGSRLDAALPAL
jgi:hypothetical protein